MNGEREKSKVTVRLNGERWSEKRAERGKTAEQPIRWNDAPGQAPATKPVRNEDAWSRLAQLRGTAETETREQQLNAILSADEGENGHYSPGSRKPVVFPDWVREQGWAKSLLTTGGAVAIGLLFGLLVLTVFNQERVTQSYQAVLSDTVHTLTAQGSETAPDQGTALTQSALSQPQAPGQKLKLKLPDERLFVAQAGAFQPDVSREAVVKPLQDAGLPHFLYRGSDKQYLFAAGSPDRDVVLGFASILKQKGIDVYVKEMTIPGGSREVALQAATTGEKLPDVGEFLQNGWKIAKTLALQSGAVVSAARQPLSKEEEAQLKEQHRQFLEESRILQTSEQWQPMIGGMVNGINQAMAARGKMAESAAGKKQASAESYAWQVQAGVLSFWESYSDWVGQLQQNS
ncbi:hypothetical protein [Brevibacillus borstelensis]|uniref:hypothetical protein n=1 Tax=Brevibacillus borstelensis TaxID=45462 RepID=UPI0030BDBC77